MNVLFVDHERECGGAELSLLDLMGGLERTRFTPLLVCSGEGPLAAAARARDLAVHCVPMLFQRRVRKFVGLLRAARALADLIRQERIDLVHVNTLLAGYVGLRAARRTGVPCVWHVRDMTYPRVGKVAVSRADAVIANSRATAGTLPEPARARCTVIHNGVDAAFFAPRDTRAELRAELGVGARCRLIGIVGRLDPWKGHDLFLGAAARVLEQTRDVALVIAGGVVLGTGRARHQRYPEFLAARARAFGIAPSVHFLGQRADVPRILAGLDVLVHPSRRPEPFGRAIVEAQACGVPVVAAAHGGILEIVTDGIDGLLVAPNDAGALAMAVARLLDDPALATRLATAAHRNARRFTVERHVEAVQHVYAGVTTTEGCQTR